MATFGTEESPIHDVLSARAADTTLPIWERLRHMALDAYMKGEISYATQQSCLNLAQIAEADAAGRNVAAIATNRNDEGDIRRR